MRKVLLLLIILSTISSFTGCNAKVPSPAGQEEQLLFPVQQGGRYGFIDKTGKIIIEPKYEKVSSFSEGLCPVFINTKWGFIDNTGKVIVEPKYDGVGKFTSGLALIKADKKTGYIDKTGKVVWEPSE